MPEEIKAPEQPKNTVALIWMICSIVWLVLFITIIFFRLWLPLLFLGFVLWIIGLCFKPRGKARVAIMIPLIVFILCMLGISHIYKSAKTPAIEFGEWANENLTEERFENIDEDKFEKLVEYEANKLAKEKTEEEWKAIYEATTWSNAIEKVSYIFFGLLQESIENALDSYDALPNEIVDDETENEDENIITVDIETEESNNNETDKETVEVFSDSEKNDIEQIINILE